MKSWLQKKWNNGKMLAELKPAFFLSLTFCFMIFIYAPLELYINNVDEFWYDVYLPVSYTHLTLPTNSLV